MKNPSDFFSGGGKTLYWDDRLETIIIDNPKNPTAFRALDGKTYFDQEVGKIQQK
jgi:hypothetical protein